MSFTDNLDYNKDLNCKCSCGERLPWKREPIVMGYPCEHLFHCSCVQLQQTCTFCGNTITKLLKLSDKLHPQRFADILSMSYYDNLSCTSPLRFIDSIFDSISVLSRIPFLNDRHDGKALCERILALNNITIKVHGIEKIKTESHKVYICNHVAPLELIIVYYLLNTGFLASSIIGQSPITEYIKKFVPLLTFNRTNGKTNTTDAIKDFVAEYGSICIFPEGMMKHPDTLARFRTGAFYVGYPIYSVTIRHNDVISDEGINGWFYKLCGKQNLYIEVHILGPYYPPFDNKSIENIRYKMARCGNMILSRVSNRLVIDT